MNATIYIHKDNSAAWEAIENKSDWVNSLLKEHKAIELEDEIPSVEEQVEALGYKYYADGAMEDKDGRMHQFIIKAGRVFKT